MSEPGVVGTLVRDLDLWRPQKEGLEALDRLASAAPFEKASTKSAAIGGLLASGALDQVISAGLFDVQAELAAGTSEFPSFCFAIATGGGKTKLMGACIAYLFQTKGWKNFFVLSKGRTVYDKHRFDDFEPASDKYVFKGLQSLPSPRVIDGDNYTRFAYPQLLAGDLNLYIFNIEKIFNERSDVEFQFHKFDEDLGMSFAQHLRSLKDLVFLMDESHNVRADKSLRAINSLRPTLGLEFTATPIVRNIIYSFSLSEAIREGIVKRPVVLTRSDDDPAKEERELIKLTDGMRRHERKRSILATYCANRGLQVIIPRVLVSTRDIAECDRIGKLLQAPSFEGGRYDGKVLTIHSGSEDDQIEALLNLERSDRHEIVVHVNKLKEGWDVKTIFTIIPLRASASDILVEQTIGRGLRLPFGHQVSRDPDAPESERDQLREIDTLEIISHDNYSRVIEARKAKGRDWAAIEVKVDTQPPNVERTEVTPDNPPAYTLTIPLIRAEFNTEGKLGLDAIVPNFASLEALSAIIKSVDLENLQERELERVREQVSADPVNYFVSQIIRNSPEFDLRDKATLQKLVKQYIAKLKVDGNLGEVLMSNRGKIITDLIVQIDQRVQDQTRITYHATGEQLRFHSYYKEIEVGQSDLAKDTAGEGVKGRIVSGYEKTAFSRNVFDSLPEKLFADVIDADKQVARWVKPPYRQLTIAYPGGSYTPDFVVQTTQGATFVVEVKQDGELEEAQRAPSTHNVALKYFAACEWCELMRQVAKASWEYRLIPASTISVTKTFSGILAEARSLHR